MLRAKINGILSRVLNRAKLKLIGEKLTVAIVGLPTDNCHHGINTEATIKTKVSMPASNAT